MRNQNRIRAYFGRLPISLTTLLLLVAFLTVFQVFQQYAYHLTSGFDFEFSWVPITTKLIISNIIWGLISPLLLYIGRKISSLKRVFDLRSFIYITFVIVITFLQNALSLWLYNFSYYLQIGYMRDFFGNNNRSDLVTGSFTSLIEGVVIIGLFMALDYQKKLANKERDLAKAQLDALKMQLHPHFIFNTLHSISSMIDIDVKKAQRMITKVGDLLRSMLAHDEVEFVTLRQEIDFIRNYLELEQIRFQDRMEVDFDIDENLTNCKVPSLILQPLVENCIKHGVAKSAGKSNVCVSAVTYQNGSPEPWLKLVVNNFNEEGLNSSGPAGFGIGLQNVKKRLEQDYLENYFCEFRKVDNQQFKSEIRIPLMV
ncbi:sensor histidine kinase [Reichenbachiella sp.]|uniref:sensor histidine kinase n=1 Tax=Reichenbachiella sp. TaxID=2184521 RepID=UPI003BB13272